MIDYVRNCKTESADVYIGRGGPYGNPFKLHRDGDRVTVIEKYEKWLRDNQYLRNMVCRLHGKTLGCYCRPSACHGDVLVKYSSHNPQPVIFVFGSNLSGKHGAGAALFARQYHQAQYGIGRGATGASYAIPTKDKILRTLSVKQIKPYVDEFLDYAKNSNTLFQVTRIGCGLAGHADNDIAELFENAPNNVLLPGKWKWYLGHKMKPRVIVAGSRSITNYQEVRKVLDSFPNFDVEIVSGGARGVDSLGEDYAVLNGLQFKRFPALWHYGKNAGYIRNQYMSWYATHLCAFWKNSSPGTAHMINTAKQDGLRVKVYD